MMTRTVTMPELAMLAATRVAGGAGLGLLLADRVGHKQRRAVGWTLLAVGVVSTFPLVAGIVLRDRRTGGRPAGATNGGAAVESIAGPGAGI